MTGTTFTASTFNSYGYNDRSEVTVGNKYTGTDITDKTSPVTAYDYGYDYDPIGNRDSYDVAGTTTTYTANQLNQYTAITSLTNPNYDDDGNMTLMPSSSGDWTLTWNAENRMTVAESATTKLEFTYDYMGRRVKKKVYTRPTPADLWSLTSDLRFVYDGWNLIAELDAADSNALVKTYTWGLDLSQTTQGAGGVGGLLAVTEQGTTPATYYATYDANGNVSEYLDATGASVTHYEYSPFGRTTVATGSKAADFAHRFSTKYLDEHGLYYYGRRSYSPDLGRWINRDPIGERGGTNVYGFVKNASVILHDLVGMADNSSGVFMCFRRIAEGFDGGNGTGSAWHAYLQIGFSWKYGWTMGWRGGKAEDAYTENSKTWPPGTTQIRFCNYTKKRRFGKLPNGTKCKCATKAQIRACVKDRKNYPEGTYDPIWRNCGDWVKIVAKKCCIKTNFNALYDGHKLQYFPTKGHKGGSAI